MRVTDTFAEMFSAESQAKRLREEADRHDGLARRARVDGDSWDEAKCRAKAMELRRQARRLEAGL